MFFFVFEVFLTLGIIILYSLDVWLNKVGIFGFGSQKLFDSLLTVYEILGCWNKYFSPLFNIETLSFLILNISEDILFG